MNGMMLAGTVLVGLDLSYILNIDVWLRNAWRRCVITSAAACDGAQTSTRFLVVSISLPHPDGMSPSTSAMATIRVLVLPAIRNIAS